ncbi:MAG: hypothetical protein COU11_04620 [Candidatus Harrisonbacteria bacterium CG10_big_fil_rev_8_21_14_0_10_49_15]|uniref:DUF5667 domain-containing protein n=1 Tax=Candidatus Harrisonbacteria bacterium CG10_big_fil_rev_8_21_14_0_10_49_15 TaxID=1974587 RepID=A0A2H0UK51_9BACT|nr:MAG: hypothetical protein COU11_04620 [Candidatus Harrisonbacteria bacterium CG10_big_fil_rev_8_21_14_0_10_49_15]
MKAVKNLIFTVLASAILIVTLGLFFSSASGDAVIPRQFFAARLRAADDSRNMARLINDSLQNLKKIDEYQRQGAVSSALDLLQFEINTATDRQEAASLLANQLEQMARTTAEMDPAAAERLAVEAVTTGVAMVSTMINYNDSLNQLFTGIQARLTGAPSEVNVSAVLAEINADAEAINRLSTSFNGLLDDFDSRYVK